MNKPNRVNGETTDMDSSHATFRRPVYGYVQPTRLYKLGKRTLVYRLPTEGKHFAVSKSLMFFLALIVAAFATGYANEGHVPDRSGMHIQPASVAPVISFHRLITISAAQGASYASIITISGGLT